MHLLMRICGCVCIFRPSWLMLILERLSKRRGKGYLESLLEAHDALRHRGLPLSEMM